MNTTTTTKPDTEPKPYTAHEAQMMSLRATIEGAEKRIDDLRDEARRALQHALTTDNTEVMADWANKALAAANRATEMVRLRFDLLGAEQAITAAMKGGN